MKTVTFSQLRNNAKKYFDAVEHGETVEVYRHGKPIAVVSPKFSSANFFEAREPRSSYEAGKNFRLVDAPGISGSREILRDRGGDIVPISTTKRFVREKFGALGTKGSLLKALMKEKEDEKKKEEGRLRGRKK